MARINTFQLGKSTAQVAFLSRQTKEPHEPSMGYRIRQIEPETKFTEGLSLEVITRVIPLETIQNLLAECRVEGQRERRLPGWWTVLVCIWMNLLSERKRAAVM